VWGGRKIPKIKPVRRPKYRKRLRSLGVKNSGNLKGWWGGGERKACGEEKKFERVRPCWAPRTPGGSVKGEGRNPRRDFEKLVGFFHKTKGHTAHALAAPQRRKIRSSQDWRDFRAGAKEAAGEHMLQAPSGTGISLRIVPLKR